MTSLKWVPATSQGRMEVPTQPFPRRADEKMTPEETQQFMEMKERINLLEAESAGLQMAVIALIANHPDQTKFHLFLSRYLELQAAPEAQALMKNLSPAQQEATRTLVEWLGAIPENKG